MPKLIACGAACGALSLALAIGGCADPAMKSTGSGGSAPSLQQGSGTGGGTEVPMPAATEGVSEQPTPEVTEPTPAATEPTPAAEGEAAPKTE
jgi:hypothetical protein